MKKLYGFFNDRIPAFWLTKMEALFSLPSPYAVLVYLALFALVAAVDVTTPPDVNPTFAYVFVIVIAAWNTNFQFALALVFVAFGIQIMTLGAVKHLFSAPLFF